MELKSYKRGANVVEVKGKVSILMPGYNEGETIYENLLETEKALQQIVNDFEIIFVNDGSSDNTLDEAKRASKLSDRIKVVNCKSNQGKGYALKVGIEYCTGEYIVFLDSDLDLHPSQLESFFRVMQEDSADVVIGSKLHPESVSNYPYRRKILSYGYYLFLRTLFRLPVKDTQTGIKLFRAEVIKPVMRKILVKRFAFDVEVLANINRLKFKISEAPVELKFRRERRWGRIKLMDIWNVFVDTIAIFYRMNILHYYDDISEEIAEQRLAKGQAKII